MIFWSNYPIWSTVLEINYNRSAGQDIHRHLWNVKVHYYVHKIRSLVPYPELH
jgi:hypothetical protein